MMLYDYTDIFSVEKKFRGAQNIRLPQHLEVPYRAAGWGAAAAAVTSLLYVMILRPVLGLLPTLLHLGLAALLIGGGTLFIAKAATSRMAHDKELLDLVKSWWNFRRRPKTFADFAPWQPTTVATAARLTVDPTE